MKQEMVGWEWHQLDHVQIICTSLQTDNHASTSSLSALNVIQSTDPNRWPGLVLSSSATGLLRGGTLLPFGVRRRVLATQKFCTAYPLVLEGQPANQG